MTIKEFESIVKKNKASASPGFHGGSNRYSRMHHPTSREPAHKRGQQRTLSSVYSAKGALKLEPDHSKMIKPPLGQLHEQ